MARTLKETEKQELVKVYVREGGKHAQGQHHNPKQTRENSPPTGSGQSREENRGKANTERPHYDLANNICVASDSTTATGFDRATGRAPTVGHLR